MSTKSEQSAPAPRGQASSNITRRGAATLQTRVMPGAAPCIQDAVHDQHGQCWIRFGTAEKTIWFALADLISDAPNVFRRLSSVGATCLTARTQTALKEVVEAHEGYRPALVSTRPGWLDEVYVFGDGTHVAPRSDTREVIVTFEPNAKFAPRGTLAGWQHAVTPFTARQPLPYFCLALALTGPILRFAPRGYVNPQAEIVGPRESGKTSLATLAASVWAGDPESDCGGGESWDTTVNALDDLKLTRADGFLFLDEGNLAGNSAKDQREFALKATFKLAATGSKRRFGDQGPGQHARLAMLSTTNTALADLLDGNDEARAAVRSRRITLRIASDAPHGVFANLPGTFTSARTASEAMAGVADRLWGRAARAFVKRLVIEADRDEEGLRRLISGGLDAYIRRDRTTPGSARVQKSFALAAVAASLAERWDIFKREWGSPFVLTQAVAQHTCEANDDMASNPVAKIQRYVEQHRANLIEVESLDDPLTKVAFEDAVGFLRQGRDGEEVLVPAATLQAAFPDYEVMMRSLRTSGHARTEGGRTPKLTIKTPRAICDGGRVYCIRLAC